MVSVTVTLTVVSVLQWWTLRNSAIRTAVFHLQTDDKIINYKILVKEDHPI